MNKIKTFIKLSLFSLVVVVPHSSFADSANQCEFEVVDATRRPISECGGIYVESKVFSVDDKGDRSEFKGFIVNQEEPIASCPETNMSDGRVGFDPNPEKLVCN